MMKQATIRRIQRGSRVMLGLVVFAAMFGQLHAQQQPSTPTGAAPTDNSTKDSSTSSSTDSSDATGSGLGSSLGSSGSLSSRNSLTAAEIDDILQQKPELVPELKSLIADQLSQQGTTVQADSITDEMLYRQIASSADLRTNITLICIILLQILTTINASAPTQGSTHWQSFQAQGWKVGRFRRILP